VPGTLSGLWHLLAKEKCCRDYKDDDEYHDWLSNPPPHICKAVEQSFDDPEPGNDGQVAHAVPQYAEPNRTKKQSRDPRNQRNIYPSVGDGKHPPLLAGGGYIHYGSCSLSTLAAAVTSSSGGVVLPGGIEPVG
jgi:hypothetical protein